MTLISHKMKSKAAGKRTKSIAFAGKADKAVKKTAGQSLSQDKAANTTIRQSLSQDRTLHKVTRAALEEAASAGLTQGAKTEHVSFRAPPALVEAAKRESGVESNSELGILALAMLAQPDPVADYMKRHRGSLGKDHQLDY